MAKYSLPQPIPLPNPYSLFRGFNFIRPIRIENSGAALRDYQVKITLTQDNFPFEKCRPDGSDIRFRADSGETVSYWIESWSNNQAIIWCKIPYIPEDSSSLLWMVYGNPTAGSQSNPDAVFDFYDDFNGAEIDTDKWIIDDSTGFSLWAGFLKGTNTAGRLRSKKQFTGPLIAESRHKIDVFATHGHEVLGTYVSSSNGFGGFLPHSNTMYFALAGSVWYQYDPSPVVTQYNWCYFKILNDYAGNSYERVEQEGSSNFHQEDFNVTVESEPIALGKRYDDNFAGEYYEGYWDWIRVRKFAYPEPTIIL